MFKERKGGGGEVIKHENKTKQFRGSKIQGKNESASEIKIQISYLFREDGSITINTTVSNLIALSTDPANPNAHRQIIVMNMRDKTTRLEHLIAQIFQLQY